MHGMNGLRIHQARGHEIPTVLALVEALLAELGGEGQEFALIDRDRLAHEITRGLSDDGSGSCRFWALLAREESGTPLGVLTLTPSFAVCAGGEYGIVREMYMLPSRRGRGVGRALLGAAVGPARERRRLRLDVAGPAEESARAVRFYESLGFEFTGPKLRLLVAGRT